METRWRGWYGLSRHDRWAIFGGQLVTPVTQFKPPYWVWNSALRQLYLSTYHLSAEAASAYLNAIRKFGVRYLWGYASALASLSRFVLDQHLEVPHLVTVISNAEPLYDHQRDIIQTAFQCPVHDTYGMSEMVCSASECEHGTMHLWPEVGIYEVLQDGSDEPVKPGETGRLISTGLLNLEMPLIRYETGDRIALAPPGSSCACGRTLPILKRIEGRSDDLIVTPSGRQVGRLDPVFKRDLPIAEAQIVQDAPDHLLVRIVQGHGYSDITESVIRHALQERLDGMRVDFEYCTSIPRSPNGKFKAVVSLLRSGPAGAG